MLAIISNNVYIQTVWTLLNLRYFPKNNLHTDDGPIPFPTVSFFHVPLPLHLHPQPYYMHSLAPSSLLWHLLNKLILFFGISLECMLKLCLKWKFNCNYYQYQARKPPLSNYTMRNLIDYFPALLRFTRRLRLGRSYSCFIGPWCQVGVSEWNLRLKNVFLFSCSRSKSIFPA